MSELVWWDYFEEGLTPFLPICSVDFEGFPRGRREERLEDVEQREEGSGCCEGLIKIYVHIATLNKYSSSKIELQNITPPHSPLMKTKCLTRSGK
jgi:hypothetical protein